MERYSHTQVGWVVLIALAGSIILMLCLFTVGAAHPVGISVLVVFGAAMVLFGTLTVVGDHRRLQIRFGPGLIRKSFLFTEIESCEEVRNPWYCGWGIRCIEHGWLFNVSGLHAVEIRMRNGKRYRIGTDDPGGLKQFIERRISGNR